MKIIMDKWELDVNEDDWNAQRPGSVVRLYGEPRFTGKKPMKLKVTLFLIAVAVFVLAAIIMTEIG